MPFDQFHDIGEITEARRKAVAQSIRKISTEELKKLAEQIFDSPDHPWRERFFQLIQNRGVTFTMSLLGRTSFLFMTLPRTKATGVCPVAA